jgi:hypothetical protein
VKRIELILIATLFLSGCATTIGRWDQTKYAATDFGSWRQVNVCMYRDVGVPPERAQQLLRETVDEWKQYGIALNVIDRGELPRQGFWHNQLIDQIDSVPLTPSCDRVFWLVNRNAADYLYANGPAFLTLGTLVAMPEVVLRMKVRTNTSRPTKRISRPLLSRRRMSASRRITRRFVKGSLKASATP